VHFAEHSNDLRLQELHAGKERPKYLPWEKAGGPNECAHGMSNALRCDHCQERIEPQDPVLCADCGEDTLEIHEELGAQRAALEAVLLFYSPSPWDSVKRDRWQEITGADECTSKGLCDHIRKILEQESEP